MVPSSPASQPDIDLADLLAALVAARWRVFRLAFAGLGLGLVLLWLTPPAYRATAVIALDRAEGRFLLPPEMRDPAGPRAGQAPAEMDVLRSQAVLLGVVRQLQLDLRVAPVTTLPPFAGLRRFRPGQVGAQLGTFTLPEGWLGQDLILTHLGEGAYRLVLPDGQQRTGRIAQRLNDPAAGWSLRVDALSVPAGQSLLLTRIAPQQAVEDLRAALTVAETQRQSGVLRLTYRADTPDKARRILQAIVAGYLAQDRQAQAEQVQQALTALAPEVAASEATWRKALARLDRSAQAAGPQPDRSRLVREADEARSRYRALFDRQQDLRALDLTAPTGLRLLDAAYAPPDPVAPQRALTLLASVLLCLLAGAVWTLLRHLHRAGRASPEGLARLGLPVLARLDSPPQPPQPPVLAGPGHQAPDAVRLLHLGLVERGVTSCLITAASADLPSAALAAELALVAAQAGQSVCLIDADLRQGRLQGWLAPQAKGQMARPGLAEVLAGAQDLSAALVATSIPGLQLLAAGLPPDDPAGLLSRPAMAAGLHALAGQFDLLLIAAPPALQGPEAALLARHVGATLLLLRQGVTPLATCRRMSERLVQVGARDIGAVLLA